MNDIDLIISRLKREVNDLLSENERLAAGNSSMEKEIPELRHQLAAVTKERDYAQKRAAEWMRCAADTKTERDALKATMAAVQATHYALSQARANAEAGRDALKALGKEQP